jgi:hypothetical protein
MRKKSSGFICLTAAVALTVGACSDDPTGVNSGDPLTAGEIEALMAAFSSALDSTGVAAQRVATSGLDGAAAAQGAVPINQSFDVSAPCESGTIQVSGSLNGTIDDQTFDMDVTMEVSWDPSGCMVSNSTTTFTVDGAPQIDLVLDMTSTSDALTMSGTETGGFSFTSSDGRVGSCALDVTFSIVTDNAGINGSATGTICGLDASDFQTLGT